MTEFIKFLIPNSLNTYYFFFPVQFQLKKQTTNHNDCLGQPIAEQISFTQSGPLYWEMQLSLP